MAYIVAMRHYLSLLSSLRVLMATSLFAMMPAFALAEPFGQPVFGPKLLCFKYSTFQLNEDERVIGFAGGSAEGMSITIVSSKGNYEIAESEIFAKPKNSKVLVSVQGATRVYRLSGSERTYAIYGSTWFTKATEAPLLYLSGPAIRSGKVAKSIYRRLAVSSPDSTNCKQVFTYGFSPEPKK